MNPKVFMIGWEFPPFNTGGLGTACAGLTAGLSKLQVDQTFLLPKKLPTNAPYLKIIKPGQGYFKQIQINFKILPYGPIIQNENTKTFSNYKSHHYSYYTEMVNQALEYADIVRSFASQEPMDLIHGHDWMTYPAAISAKRVAKKPLVLHIHATEFDRTLNGNLNPEIHAIEEEGFRKADRIIAVSNYTKQIVVDKYHIDSDKIKVVHNGIDLTDSFRYQISQAQLDSFAKGKKLISFVGRLTSQKGPDYFLQAAAKIAQADNKTIFVIAGDGDMYQQMLNQAGRYHLTGKLLFTGFLRDYQKQFLYQRSDLFIMPSVSEPFGLVALEAAAAKTPIIISKQSGVKEVMPEAITTNFWDVDDIVQKSLRVLKNSDYAQELGQKVFEQTQRVTWDKAAQKCLAIYQQMI